MIKQDPTVMSWGLWISTLTTTSAALVTAGLAALLAVLNTATSPRSKILSDPGVYFINILTRTSMKVFNFKYLIQINCFKVKITKKQSFSKIK